MEIEILGSGTSHGVPMIGCTCPVCTSDNPKNRRMRPSILVRHNDQALVVDTGPEFRLQALAAGLNRLQGVLYTHTHADHIFGLDDLRRFSDMMQVEIPVYGDCRIHDDIRRIFNYIFVNTQAGGGKPRISLNELQPEMTLIGLTIRPFRVLHGRLEVNAYRFEAPATTDQPARAAAYVTDVSFIPEECFPLLQNLDLLILDAVRFDPHPTHFGLWQALEVIEKVQPRQALLTHLSHHFDHDKVNASLPQGVALAYDGQKISF